MKGMHPSQVTTTPDKKDEKVKFVKPKESPGMKEG